MKQPKVYIKSLDRVFEVESIRFDTKVIEAYDESCNMYRFFDFDEVEFIYNTGYKDINGNYIYTGDKLEYQSADEHYLRRCIVEKDEETEFYYLTNKRNFVSRLMNMHECLVIGNIYENKELFAC